MQPNDFTIAEELEDFVSGTSEPYELHFFADYFDWEYGCAPLIQLIKNPACDLNTAKLIFWRAGPEAYQKYLNRSEVVEDPEVWDLIQEIMSRVAAKKFGEAKIPWYPREHGALSGEREDHKWQVPEALREELIDPKRIEPPDPATSTQCKIELPDATAEWNQIYDYFSKQEVVYTSRIYSESQGRLVEPAPYVLLVGLLAREDSESGLRAGLDHPSPITAAYCANGLRNLGVKKAFQGASIDRDAIILQLKNRSETVRICRGMEEFYRPLIDAFDSRLDPWW